LTEVEFTSKILLGALQKQKQVNPVDYIYDCLQANLTVLSDKSPEYELIL